MAQGSFIPLQSYSKKNSNFLWSICLYYFEFPKKATLLITAKQKVQYDLQRCVTFQLSLLFTLLRFITTWWHEINLLCRSFSWKGLVQSSKKRQRKKKSLQHYGALSDNCMENKMFVSKTDRSKWPARPEFDRSSLRSGRTLSVDWPLFSAL